MKKEVLQLRNEIETLRNTVNNLMLYIIERELEEQEYDENGPFSSEDKMFRKNNLKIFN